MDLVRISVIVETSIPARSRWIRIAATIGPGIVVMLADTDAGSIITAAQSGAQSGYRLLLLQFAMIPVLFLIQEITIRLGIVTGQGHGRAIRQHFGPFWAWVSVATLLLACLGALITELSGIASVGSFIDVPAWLSVGIVVTGLSVMAYTGSYRTVERIALAFGLFECVFLLVAWRVHSDVAAAISTVRTMPFVQSHDMYLAAANIGAVIMPWMIFYQQSAVAEKGLTLADLRVARWDTAIGSVITQLIMIAVLVVTAATLGRTGARHTLDTYQQIAQALTPFLGKQMGALMFALGLIGAALVATIVVTLTAARTLCEVLDCEHSLEHGPSEAPWFYAIYTLALLLGGALVVSGVNLVQLSIGVQVMNALVLPIVLGFLYMLARRSLPAHCGLRGGYAFLVGVTMATTAGFGVYAGIVGTFTS